MKNKGKKKYTSRSLKMSVLTQFGEGSPGDPSGDEGEPDQRRHPGWCREDATWSTLQRWRNRNQQQRYRKCVRWPARHGIYELTPLSPSEQSRPTRSDGKIYHGRMPPFNSVRAVPRVPVLLFDRIRDNLHAESCEGRSGLMGLMAGAENFRETLIGIFQFFMEL